MAPSLSTFAVFLCLALVFAFIAPSLARKSNSKEQSALLKDLCSKTKNQNTCVKFLKSDDRSDKANEREFTEIAIDLAFNKAKDIHFDLNKLSDKTENSKSKEKYQSCSKNYNDAIRDLETTKKLFKEKEYSRIATQVNDALDEIKDCKETFDDSKVSSSIKKRNKEFEVLVDVVRVFAKRLAKED